MWRNKRGIAAVFVVALALVGLFFFLERIRGSQFRWDLFSAVFRQLDQRWILLAVLMIFFAYVVRALRWQVMIRPIAERAPLGGILVATVIGFTAIVLFGRPGELVRPYLISLKAKVPFSSQLATWLLERIYDLLAVIVIFGFALSQIQLDPMRLSPALQTVIRTGGYFVGGLGAICVVILYLLASHSAFMRQRLVDGLGVLPDRIRERFVQVVDAFIGGTQSSRSRRFVSLLFGYTALEWLTILLANYCIFRSFPLTSGFGAIENLVFVGFVAFGSIVQLPGIGGGMQVAAVVVLTELLGLSLETSTGFALLIWLTTYVVVVPAGLLLTMREGLTFKSLREMGAKQQAA